MSKKSHETSDDLRAKELLQAGVAGELELLKQERKAERQLAAAMATLAKHEQRLQRFQSQVEESQKMVFEAEAALRESQTRRAAGPRPPQDQAVPSRWAIRSDAAQKRSISADCSPNDIGRG